MIDQFLFGWVSNNPITAIILLFAICGGVIPYLAIKYDIID